MNRIKQSPTEEDEEPKEPSIEPYLSETNASEMKQCWKEILGAPFVQKIHPENNDEERHYRVEAGVGPWYEKLFTLDYLFKRIDAKQIQTEYFIQKEHLAEVMTKLYESREFFTHLLKVCEVREIAADKIPRSPMNTNYHNGAR